MIFNGNHQKVSFLFEVTIPAIKPITVFDAAQTEGNPLPLIGTEELDKEGYDFIDGIVNNPQRDLQKDNAATSERQKAEKGKAFLAERLKEKKEEVNRKGKNSQCLYVHNIQTNGILKKLLKGAVKMKAKTTMMKRITSILLCLAMVVTMLPAMSQQATAATISNPRIVADSSMKAGQKVTWDCIWFGSYPQTEIVSDKSQCGTVGKGYETSSDYEVNEGLYNSLKNATYDSNGDTTVEGVKYRRLQKSDTTYSSNSSGYYSWSDRTYHYFRYDKIKWRVLNTDGTTALLLADKALDDQRYNTEDPSITWEKSTIRSWLNGYGSSYNLYGTDYTSKNFVNTAFSSSERGAIKSCSVVNDSNIEYGTAGGNNTTDKIFLLSEIEVYKTDTASSYGFVKDWDTYDEARRCKSSTYAKAVVRVAPLVCTTVATSITMVIVSTTASIVVCVPL